MSRVGAAVKDRPSLPSMGMSVLVMAARSAYLPYWASASLPMWGSLVCSSASAAASDVGWSVIVGLPGAPGGPPGAVFVPGAPPVAVPVGDGDVVLGVVLTAARGGHDVGEAHSGLIDRIAASIAAVCAGLLAPAPPSHAR